MCGSTGKFLRRPRAAEMKNCEDSDALNTRTFDESRCDSTAALEKELKQTAQKCSIMAEKLTKSASLQKHRKQQHGSSWEQQTGMEELQQLVATLKRRVAALQTENMMFQMQQKSARHNEQHAGLETDELLPLLANLECKILALQTENAKLLKLKMNEHYNGILGEKQNETPENNSPSTELQHKMSALRAENLKLRQLLKDVTEVNKRWQKYNSETQAYIQRLENSIRNQTQRLDSSLFLRDEEQTAEKRSARIPQSSRHSDSQLEQTAGQTALRLRYENAVKEVCKFQKQVEETQEVQEALMQQMDILRKEKADQLMLLELQTKAYREDWEAEKKEKLIAQEKVAQLTEEIKEAEKKQKLIAQEKIAQLTEEIKELQTELKDCKRRLKHIQATSSGANQPESFWNKGKPTAPLHSRLTGIRSWASALTERPCQINSVGILVADSADETQKSQSAPSSWQEVKVDDIDDSSLTDDDKNALECPGCKKTFPRSLHLQFLDHFEECQAPHVES